MKDFKRIIAFVLTLVFIMGTFACAAYADTVNVADAVNVADTVKLSAKNEPAATIVSPANKLIVSSDNFLVSVKLNKAATIRVSVYEQKAVEKKIVTTYVSAVAVTKEALSFKTFDTKDFELKDFTSNAALDASHGELIATPATFTSEDTIGFYTSKMENIKSGIYKVVVDTIETTTLTDAKTGTEVEVTKVIESTSSILCVKEKQESEPKVFLETKEKKEKTSVLTVVSNFLKSLFK